MLVNVFTNKKSIVHPRHIRKTQQVRVIRRKIAKQKINMLFSLKKLSAFQ